MTRVIKLLDLTLMHHDNIIGGARTIDTLHDYAATTTVLYLLSLRGGNNLLILIMT
jgi:hypothetical protein